MWPEPAWIELSSPGARFLLIPTCYAQLLKARVASCDGESFEIRVLVNG
jgi:hypothetical protein